MTDEQAPERAPGDNPEPDPTPAPPAMAAYTPPPVAPPAMAQPAVAWAPPPAAAAVAGSRTPLAALAGIILLILGILGGLFGILITVLGSTVISQLTDIADIPDLEGADSGAILGGMVAFIGILILLYSLVYFLGGIGVLRSRGWGRTMGLIVGILSGLIWLSALANAGKYADDGTGSVIFAVVMLIAHAYIVVTLILFWRTKPRPA